MTLTSTPPSQDSWLNRVGRRLQLDRPLVYALIAKSWQAITGPITLALVIGTMTLAERGVYYGLVSIVGIQAIFELGLLNVMISHAGSQAIVAADPQHPENQLASQRMGLLIRSSQRWFLGTSLVFVVAGWISGWITLDKVSTPQDWWPPLLVVVPAAAVSIALAPKLAILEGAGFRESVYRLRLWQMVSGSLLVWCSLLMGFKLWTLVVATSLQAIWAAYGVYIQHAGFFARYRQTSAPSDGFSWWHDVLPMQWRTAVVSISHYLASQLFVLVILGRTAMDAADEAGRMGPTLTVTAAIQMLALAWVQTKYAVVAAQHGAGNREAAGTLWRQTALVSSGFLTLALLAFWLLIIALPWLGMNIERNFIAPWQLACLSAGYIANHLLGLQSFYVLSRRANPFWIHASLGFLFTAVVVWYFGRTYSVSGLVVAYTAAMCLVALPLHSWAYWQFRAAK